MPVCLCLFRVYGRATLVVCAVSLVGQWIDEAMSKLHTPRIYQAPPCLCCPVGQMLHPLQTVQEVSMQVSSLACC